jgi:hypothetical protein
VLSTGRACVEKRRGNFESVPSSSQSILLPPQTMLKRLDNGETVPLKGLHWCQIGRHYHFEVE